MSFRDYPWYIKLIVYFNLGIIFYGAFAFNKPEADPRGMKQIICGSIILILTAVQLFLLFRLKKKQKIGN